MGEIIRGGEVIVGNDVFCKITTYDINDALMDADGDVLVTITKGDPPITIVAETAMTKVGLGKYEYNWDTQLASPGEYDIWYVGVVNGADFKRHDTVTLVWEET